MNKNLLCLLLIIAYAQSITGAHIVGGDATYTCISSNSVTQVTTFEITFSIYRDASGTGAAFDNPAKFGIYASSNNQDWEFRQRLDIARGIITTLDYSNDCFQLPPTLSVEKTTYIFEVELPWGDETYKIAYQRCCRNNTINNIEMPEATGAAYFIDISPTAITNCNNSPVFNNFPPILICQNMSLSYDSGGRDIDGDSLVFEFCHPVTAGGTDGATTPGDAFSCTGVFPDPDRCPPPFELVTFRFPFYSFTNPLGTTADLQVDPITGLMTGRPDLLGQFVVGVCIKEYRNGVLIGEVKRDFQFNVSTCVSAEATIDTALCSGDTLLINGEAFTDAGTYFQDLSDINGCDSVVIIQLEVVAMDTSYRNETICTGDRVEINGIIYEEAGDYIQFIMNAGGCDDILAINILALDTTHGRIDTLACAGNRTTINNVTYDDIGTYVQVLTGQNGCDSILTIVIRPKDPTQALLQYALCPDTILTVNGVTYDATGMYEQVLTNAEGCDSILTIVIKPLFQTKEVINRSLCFDNEWTINDVTYNQAGQYTQHLTNAAGCDSLLHINISDCEGSILYDFDQCDARGNLNPMIYEEFTPEYSLNGLCGSVNASIVYRANPEANKHSCTPGFNGTRAMCVSSVDSCQIGDMEEQAIVVDIQIGAILAGKVLQWSGLTFNHKSPEMFDWVLGDKGVNNYPTKYDISIWKDGVKIYTETNLPTMDQWERKTIDLNGIHDFILDDSASYKVAITPYCLIGNTSTVSAWDIEDMQLVFTCYDKVTRTIQGQVYGAQALGHPVYIHRKNLETQELTTYTTASDGSFKLPQNHIDVEYLIFATYHEQVLLGVDEADIDLIKRYILKQAAMPEKWQRIAADVNRDQRISMADVNHIRRVLHGLDTTFLNNASYIIVKPSSLNELDSLSNIELEYHVPKGSNNVIGLNFIPIKIGNVDQR